jgi:GDPmannose 4,6-dehydratase
VNGRDAEDNVFSGDVLGEATLLGDPGKAKDKLGWVPEITVQQMCAEMVREDLKVAQRHALLKRHGHDVQVAVES